MNTQNDYWIPQFKWQLVDWLFAHYHGQQSKASINAKPKKQLYAWYFRIRNTPPKPDPIHKQLELFPA